jgi:hypothetical protein
MLKHVVHVESPLVRAFVPVVAATVSDETPAFFAKVGFNLPETAEISAGSKEQTS